MIYRTKENKAVPLHHAGAKWEREYSCYSFVTLVRYGVSGQRHASAVPYPRESTLGTYCTGGWVGLRADLDTEVRGEVLCLWRGSNPVRPVCSQTLY
jgi:hypothetical protein